MTEPPPAPPQLPTPGSEQIGLLKTINCSCPAGEKVIHPAFTVLPQPPVASELSVAGQAAWQDRSDSELKLTASHHTWPTGPGWPQAHSGFQTTIVFLGMSVSLLLCMMEGRFSDVGLINVFLQLIMCYGGLPGCYLRPHPSCCFLWLTTHTNLNICHYVCGVCVCGCGCIFMNKGLAIILSFTKCFMLVNIHTYIYWAH